MPMAPIFSLYDVVPVPDPHIPANTHPMPSTSIPDNTHYTSKILN